MEQKKPLNFAQALRLKAGQNKGPQEEPRETQVAEQPPLSPSGGQTPSVPLSTIPIAPERDFNRRANSLERDTLPSGMFPGSSKKLYDALYLRTRGAVKPVRTIRATKRDLADWSGIRNRKTIDGHLRYLTTCGLLERKWELGNNEGYLFEVRLPEETPLVDRGGQRDRPLEGSDQKWDTGGQSQVIEKSTTSIQPKTIIKTNINDDEYSELFDILRAITEELTGKAMRPQDKGKWAEVGRVLADELKEAAARAESISSVPAFLAEHLKRRLARPERRPREGNRSKQTTSANVSVATTTPPVDRRLTPEEITEQAGIIREVIEGGYTMEQAEAQFKGSFHPDDWQQIQERVEK